MRPEYSRREMAILVRTNAQTRAFEEELLKQQVPYELVGGVRFYERAEIKDLVAYLRVLKNPRDNFALQRIINRPPRGIGKTTLTRLTDEAGQLGGSIWEAICQLEPASYPARSAKAIKAFRDLLQSLQEAAADMPLPILLERVIRDTEYTELYRQKSEESEARLENIRELLTAAQEFGESSEDEEADSLTAFLDHASLVSDIDQWTADRGLSLMTLHSAKGLEFDVVVVGGLEEGLLPHFNAGDALEEVEEERRLLYVGMTRARRRLLLTTARRRRIAGRYQERAESRFVAEIPQEMVQTSESSRLFHDERSRSVLSFFDREPAAGLPTPEKGSGSLRRGQRVRHGTLGEGIVLAVEGEGEGMKITIYFDRAGKRKVLAKFAKLELL